MMIKFKEIKLVFTKLANVKLLFLLILALLPIVVVFFEDKPIPAFIVSLVFITALNKQKFKNLYSNKKLLKPYLVMVLVFILYTILAIEITLGLKILERQISLILIPILVFSYNFKVSDYRFFFRIFIFSLLFIFFLSFFLLFLFMYNYSDWIYTINELSSSRTYLQFKFPHLIGAHPTYWSYLLVLGNSFLLSAKSLKLNFKNSLILVLLIIFNFNLLFLSARTPLVINIIIHIIALTIYIKTIGLSVKKIVLGVAAISVFLILAFNLPLIKAKLLFSTSDERVYLWNAAFEQIKTNYFVLGEGLGQGVKIMKSYIVQNGDPRVHYNGFDLHNQFLTHYLEMGILGLVSLVYLILSPVILNAQFRISIFLPAISLSLLFMLGTLTEASLYFIKGIIIFAVFSSILIKFQKYN